MKKRDWFIIILPLIFTWLIDHITKVWASSMVQPMDLGPISFMLFHNHGAIMGLFSGLPAVLRVVSLSTGGAFILCTYALIQYLLPIKSIRLRTGLSFLLGGIVGNVTDRILWGFVVDFIIIKIPGFSSPAFNLADAIQWIGYVLIVYSIIKEGDLIWPENNIREKYWVNMSFQLKYCFILMGIGLSLSLISIVFSYTYLKVTILDLVGNNPILLNKFLQPFLLTFSIIAVAFCAILFAVGKVISHRIAGPLYAFERFLTATLNGQPSTLKLRKGDEFKHLEELASQVSARLAVIKNERTVHVIEFSDDDGSN